MQKIKNKLLLTAIITAFVLWVGLMAFSIIYSDINIEKHSKEMLDFYVDQTDENLNLIKEKYKEMKAEQNRNLIIATGIGLLFLAIPSSLIIIGERKNKRKLILASGIVYIFTVVGIPSAIMCFIVNARMKKEAQ